LIRQIILNIKRYPKKTSEEKTSKEETISLPRKMSGLEILGLFFIFGSIISTLVTGIQRYSNPMTLLIDIIFNPALAVGLIIFLYGRVRRLKK
jgi:hypothetical protein